MSKRSKILVAGIIAIIIALGIGFWLVSRQKPETNSINIGAVLPLTGSAAQWGGPARDGALLAIDEINNEGGINGKKISLIVEDDKCDPTTGVSATQKLLNSDNPVAIMGAVCSSVTLAIAPIAERDKEILVSPASTNPQITSAGDYIFRVIPTDALRGKVFADYISSQGHKNVSILYINNDGGVGNKDAFSTYFQQAGGKIVSVESYAQDARDMRTQLTKIKQAKPDAVLIVSYPDDTPIVLRQAQELALGVPLFFQTEALDDPAVIQKAGNAAEGAIYILPAKPEGNVAVNFAAQYKEKYGRDPETFAAESYDTIKLLAAIMKSQPNISSESIKTGLYATKNYEGASGVITFDENGDVIKPMAIKKINGGNPELIKKQ
jgi:branched-chain amino acid transport system substrate-binding protein